MKFHTIYAVFLRNVQSYFTGALGYLILVVFVFICSLLAFNEQFFADNLATLDQLSRWYPLLLLFLVPAITMGVWAEERKQSTDELLFTLPASDGEVLLGKYLAVLAVYTVALLFSTNLLIVLARIGDPHWGTVLSTYFGYWLAGSALLAAGMFASSLTRSTTVAFVVGVLLSAVPVFLEYTAGFLARFGPGVSATAYTLSLGEQLRPFTEGLIPLTGILYFVSLAAFLLYLNFVVITRRHWSGGKQARMGSQYAIRVLALAVTLVCFNIILQKGNAYVPQGVDLSAEKVHTLSPTTRKLLQKLVADEQPIFIQAFLSPDVPDEFVLLRKRLINLLEQYDRLGDRFLTVRVVDVRHASPEEREAQTQGIERFTHQVHDREGRVVEQALYLGVVIQGEKGKVVIPHFRNSLQLEYELTRSLGTLLEEEKLRVGILRTDARVLGMGKPWFFDRFAEELRKQYEVIDVSHADLARWVQPAEKKPEAQKKKDSDGKKPSAQRPAAAHRTPDVLVVVQVTSLPQVVLENLVQYVQAGHPALIFADPLPFYLVYDQTGIDDYFRGEVSEIIDAPKLRRPQPRSYWAIEMIPKPVLPKLNNWLQEQGRRRMIRTQAQFEDLLREGTEQFYPEAVPQVSAAFPIRKADGGTAETLMRALGLTWNHGEVVADTFQPHLDFNPAIPDKLAEQRGPSWPVSDYGQQDNAFLFLARAGGNPHALNARHVITKGLREIMAIYSGCIYTRPGSQTTVTPLLQTSRTAALIDWEELALKTTRLIEVRDIETGRVIRTESEEVESRLTNNLRPGNRGERYELNPALFPRNPRYVLADKPQRRPPKTGDDGKPEPQTIAVLITGKAGAEKTNSKTEKSTKTGKTPENNAGKTPKQNGNNASRKKAETDDPGNRNLKVVFVADCDLISNVFFRQREALGLPLDNLNFVMNAIEFLAGEEEYLPLRSRQPHRQALTAIQKRVDEFRRQRFEAERRAKDDVEKQVKKAQQNYEERLKKIGEAKDLNLLQKDQLRAVALRTELERLQAEKNRLERELQEKLAQLKDEEDRQIRTYQNRVRTVAVSLTPLPAFLLGLVVLCVRWVNERRRVTPSRHI